MEKRNDTICYADWLLLFLLLRQKQWSIDYSWVLVLRSGGHLLRQDYHTSWSKIVKKTTDFPWKRERTCSDAQTDSSSFFFFFFCDKTSGALIVLGSWFWGLEATYDYRIIIRAGSKTCMKSFHGKEKWCALMRRQTPSSAAKAVEQGLSTEATEPYQCNGFPWQSLATPMILIRNRRKTGWVDSSLSAVYGHWMFWNYVLQDWEYASKYWNQVFAHLGSVWLCTKETWDMPCVGYAYTIVLPNVGHRGNLGWNWILCTRTFQVSSDTHCVHNRFTQGQSQRKPGVKLNIMCVLCTLNAHILGRASEMHNNFTQGRSQRMM